MKKIPTLILFSLLSLFVIAKQYEYVPFPDSGAIWSEIYYFSNPTLPNEVYKQPSYERFAVNGEDTVINDTSYKKLYLFHDTTFKKEKAFCIGGIREDSLKRIFFKGDTLIHGCKPCYCYTYSPLETMKKELLLYDFSLEIGDTFKNGNYSMPEEILTIKDIDTILYGGKYRKVFSFDPIWWVFWIEGIGSVKGLLFTSGDLPSNGLNDDLICFSLNGERIYFNDEYEYCYPPASRITDISYKEIIVYPNPASDELYFDFTKDEINRLIVYNSNCKEKANFNITNQDHFIIKTEKYQPGIYFYKATNPYGMLYTGKFVVK